MNGGANFTNKSQEAIFEAQNLARENGQQQVDALHLLLALLSQEESVVLNLVQRIGVNLETIKQKVKLALSQIPKIVAPQAFGQLYLTQDLAKIFDRARQEAEKMGDEFISVEHLFLALLSAETKAKEILIKAEIFKMEGQLAESKKGELNYDSVLKILAQIRGGERITDVEPESKY